MDDLLGGELIRLLDAASTGWAGLRRWTLDHGDPHALSGEVRQDPGTAGYRLRRMFAGTAHLSSLPATYDVLDAGGRPQLRITIGKAHLAHTAPATVATPDGAPLGLVPASGAPVGGGQTATTPDGRPAVLVVPDGRGLSWSALDPHGAPLAEVGHLAARPAWIDRRVRPADPVGGRAPGEDARTSGTVVRFRDPASALERALVLGLAVCRAHQRR